MEMTFDAELYLWKPGAAWVFVTLSTDDSDAIDDATSMTGGFGSVKVEVQTGDTRWSTSLFPSKEEAAYVLPIKKEVRKAEGIDVGDTATFTITLVHV